MEYNKRVVWVFFFAIETLILYAAENKHGYL